MLSIRSIIFLIIFIISQSIPFQNWRMDRRPKLMGNRVPIKIIHPHRKAVQRKIVQFHNFFRTKVLPPSSNMLKLSWHKGAAKAAQRWAHECMFLTHDSVVGRHIDGYGACGQNIFVSTQRVPWLFAIKTWWLEKDNFTYGSAQNNLKVVGHYTQMVWASTHQVGCGLARCNRHANHFGSMYYSYICNYCPIGNKRAKLGRPYKRGTPCGRCKKHCFAGKLCTNSCEVADYWANCRELFKVWPFWLCNDTTSKGKERMNNCLATCLCKRNKIHD